MNIEELLETLKREVPAAVDGVLTSGVELTKLVQEKGPEALADTTKSAALELANAERSQCAHVQAFVGKKSAGLL